jgi:glycosyltransferase involved in cell wall biosynthesis
VGKKFADKNNLRHYCWILGQDARFSNTYPKSLQLKTDELIGLSDFLQDEFYKSHGIKPAFVIPPGIDSKQFNSTIKEKDIDLLAAGSLIPLKQFEIFIEVVAELKKQIPGIKSALIGNGPEKNKLKALIEKHELQSNITLAGELQYQEVLQWMQRAKVFLHPSSYEGFSGVCQEALAAGAHVISFCKPMKQDINHWHIVNNTTEMKNLALEILQNSDISFEKAISFDVNDSAKKMMKLFEA